MDDKDKILAGVSTMFLVLFGLVEYAWMNIFLMTNMLTPPVQLTSVQAQAIHVQGMVAIYSNFAVVALYMVVIMHLLVMPYIDMILKKYKFVIEEKPDGTTDNDSREKATQL